MRRLRFRNAGGRSLSRELARAREIRRVFLVFADPDKFRAGEFYRPFIGRLDSDDGIRQTITDKVKNLNEYARFDHSSEPVGEILIAVFELLQAKLCANPAPRAVLNPEYKEGAISPC